MMRMLRPAAAALAVAMLLGACSRSAAEAPPTTTTTSTTVATTTTTTPPPPVSALTGTLVEPALATRPVVAVKFDNVVGRSTPQAGINSADVVYEIQVEGQITRLLALYQTRDAGPLGPVRSARGSEVAILEELNSPIYTWHGANDILNHVVRSSSVIPRSFEEIPELFYRVTNRKAPYNSYVLGTGQIRATVPDDLRGPTGPVLTFAAEGEPPSAAALPASHVHIRFPPPFGRGGGEAPVDYRWDGARWLRWQRGQPHVDVDGLQVAADNVIVRFTGVLDSGTVDGSGAIVPTASFVGHGEAWVLTGGTVTTGKWHKPSATAPTRYYDQAGAEIRLRPGITWISVPHAVGSSFFR